ncbi:MAG: GNAT family N-acetyltransferase [Phototrophicales bacterium]
MPVKLIRPTPTYKDSFIAAVKEFRLDRHERYQQIDPEQLAKTFDEYVQQELSRETTPPFPGGVTDSIYWLVDEQGFIGRSSLRHTLNDFLHQFGGHIGYEVRPSRRREGHATAMLKLVLIEAQKRGMKRVMLTCDDDNIGSQKVIQKNGGVLQDVVKLDFRDRPTMRWWIDLE